MRIVPNLPVHQVRLPPALALKKQVQPVPTVKPICWEYVDLHRQDVGRFINTQA